jgi:hypothetical protein
MLFFWFGVFACAALVVYGLSELSVALVRWILRGK